MHHYDFMFKKASLAIVQSTSKSAFVNIRAWFDAYHVTRPRTRGEHADMP